MERNGTKLIFFDLYFCTISRRFDMPKDDKDSLIFNAALMSS